MNLGLALCNKKSRTDGDINAAVGTAMRLAVSSIDFPAVLLYGVLGRLWSRSCPPRPASEGDDSRALHGHVRLSPQRLSSAKAESPRTDKR